MRLACRIARIPTGSSAWYDHLLLDIPRQQGNVEDQRQPITIDEEQERQETVYSSLRDDVGVQAVAKIDGVNVVAISWKYMLAW